MTSDDQDVRARAMTEAGAVARGRSVPGDPAAVAAEALPDGALPDGAPPDGALADGVSGALGTSAAPARDRRRSFWRELPVLVVVALVIALVIKTFVVQAFFIPSASMEDTLRIGDKVLVNKLVYHFRKIEPGDVVVFNGAGSWDPVPGPAKASPDPAVRLYDATLGRLLHSISGLFGTVPGQTDYIKRVIGVPGDRVACCTAGGLVTVNGVPLHEKSYLYPGNAPGDTPQGFSRHFDITVPPGRLWVMGDYRAVSEDSRLRAGDPGQGTIPESQVIGRAFVIVWPPGRWRVLPIPSTFSQPGVGRPDAAAAPSSPLLPLAAGLAGAVPVTWLRRRLRRRPGRRRR
jgi:signal peptidase I